MFEETNIKMYWCAKSVTGIRFASVNIIFCTPMNPDIGLFKHQ